MRYYYKLSEYSQGGETKHFLPEGGMQKSYENSNSQITWKAMGEYRDSFNDIHELEVMAGTELRKTWYETLFSAGYGFDRKTLTTKPVISPTKVTPRLSRSIRQRIRRMLMYLSTLRPLTLC